MVLEISVKRILTSSILNKEDDDGLYKPGNILNYSCDIFDSERPLTDMFNQPIDDQMTSKRANQKYLNKMKSKLKDTLKTLISEKKKEKEKQDKLIAKYNDFISIKFNH